ncbi:hypothetical protein GCM10017653_39510 [Ancylobacter defluvii]|uniref:DUF1810 family protein n=1 Tax=Ancylobacter defluvii TaxID=1282440 RepID=A0A9W6K0C5_9HYPH|nr:DUF1810 family protein [Ancylobacter defluvii]GLK85881.1 hypothetical protein GCM10017653_39510 [Ancylobacter defluvii]
MTDADLLRFVTAQNPVIGQVEAELAAGRKRTHWMWFVFPQLAGLGSSPNARFFALADLDQARRYLADPVLANACGAMCARCSGTPACRFGRSSARRTISSSAPA